MGNQGYKREFKKGEYEEAIQYAKELMNKGLGATAIMNMTNVTENDIAKIQEKRNKEYNDRLQ